MRQVEHLQAALSQAQDVDVCAQRGCRLSTVDAGGEAWRQGERPGGRTSAVVPWRDPDWRHPTVRALRSRVTAQAGELDSLRVENGLLRRWVSQRVDPADADSSGV